MKAIISIYYIKKYLTKAGQAVVVAISTITTAFASSMGNPMPWDGPLTAVQNALTGTTAHTIIVICIAGTGIAFACGEHGSLFRKGAAIIFGGSVAVGAVSLYSTLGFAGALV